ncbi:MAG: hypothetical protein KDB03_28145 [Planctomycetales bacterium]|nr:hypothetical protein [Planctomycetales bacterium]
MNSTTTLAPTAHPWRSLLWKDAQLLKQAILAIALSLVGIQLLIVAGSLFLNEAQAARQCETTLLMLVASPFFVSLAGSAMLIGHERQMGTWLWNSSLPISWLKALASKMMILASYAILVGIASSLIPIILILTGSMQITLAESFTPIYASAATLYLVLETFVFFSIAVLLFREPMTGLASAAVFLVVYQLSMASVIDSFATSNTWTIVLHFVRSVVLITSGLILFLVYRWRWQSGMYADWSRSPRGQNLRSALRAARFVAIPAPSNLRMLFQLAISNQVWIRLGILLLMSWGILAIQNDGWVVLVATGLGVLGATSFAGSKPLKRYQFLVDRGVSPNNFLITHVSAAFLWFLPVLLLSAFELNNIPASQLVFNIMLLITIWVNSFGIGVLASITMRLPIAALTMSAIFSFAIMLGTVPFVNHRIFPLWSPNGLTVINYYWLWYSPALLVLVLMIRSSIRQLVFQASESMPKLFTYTVLIVLLSPGLLATTFSFLLIPRSNINVAEFSEQELAIELPPFRQASLPYLEPSLNYVHAYTLQLSSAEVQEAAASFRAYDPDANQKFLEALSNLDAVLEQPTEKHSWANANTSSGRVSMLFESLAKIALVAAQENNKELLEKALRTYAALRKSAVPMQSLQFNQLLLWNMIANRPQQFVDTMGSSQALLNILPASYTSEEIDGMCKRALAQELYYARHHLGAYGKDVVLYYPPIRWAVERWLLLEYSENMLSVLPNLKRDLEQRDLVVTLINSTQPRNDLDRAPVENFSPGIGVP